MRFARQTGLPVAVRRRRPQLPRALGLRRRDRHRSRLDEGDPSRSRDTHRRVQAGARLADLDRETQEFGLAAPAGIVSHTGVAGLTLGGGIGWLMRKHGLTIDQLLAVDLVTADGQFVKASATENAELFWGLRGGGGNFGIVTEFEFRLNPVGPILLGGPIYWPMESSPNVLRFYRDWIADAPDELTTIVFHRTAPALPAVPPEIRGKLVVIVGCCYAGPVADGEAVDPAAQAVRVAAARSLPADALPCPPSDARPVLHPRLAVLHPLLRRRRAHRRCDRHHRRARPRDELTADDLPDLSPGRCRRASRRTRNRLQRTRRRPLDQRRGDHGNGGRVRRGARMGARISGRPSHHTTPAST